MVKQMTLAEAEAQSNEALQQLATAQATLFDLEKNIGDIAVTEGLTLDSANERITKAQIAVRMCETRVKMAEVAVENARKQKQQERIVKLRQQADEAEIKAKGYADFLTEWQPKVDEAKQQFEHYARQMQRSRSQADDLELRYGTE